MSDKPKTTTAIHMDNVDGLRIYGGDIRGFDRGIVVTNSRDAEIHNPKITSREAISALTELEQSIARLQVANEEKEALHAQIRELRDAAGSSKVRKIYDGLIASAANHVALLPLIEKLWKATGGQ